MEDAFEIEDDVQSMPLSAPQEAQGELMSRSTELNSPTLSPKPPRSDDRAGGRTLQEILAAKHICPFCGSQNPAPAVGATAGPCPKCTMEDTAATRQATKARIGPWHVLQTRNPAAPGMRYATLLALIAKGQVSGRSIVRGPTTHQLWRWAGHVRGLSREFGVCYSCGQALERTASHCPNCDRSQEPQGNPDALLENRESKDNRAAAGMLGNAAYNGGSPTPALGYTAPANSSGALAADGASADGYAVRSAAASHADRLRNNGEYRPVDSRIETRSDLPGGNRRRDGRILSSMELAAALQVAPATPPVTPGHPIRTALLTILIVGALAASVIGYFRPDLRRQSADWLQTTWEPIQNRLSGFSLQKPPPTPAAPSNTDTDTTANDTGSPSNSPESSPSASPSPSMTESTPQTMTQATPPRSTETPGAGSNPTENNGASVGQPATPSNTPSISPSTPAAAPSINSATPPATPPENTPDNIASADTSEHPSLMRERAKLSPGSPLDAKEIWALRNRALDAESREDWSAEIALLQQIETSPKELWPADTKVRLANARRALASR